MCPRGHALRMRSGKSTPVSDPLVSWRQLQPTVQTVGKSGTCRGSTTPLFPARSSHGARNTRLTSAAVMPSFLLPPSFLLSPVRVSCPERTFLKVRASEHGHGFSKPCAAFTPTRAHVMACLIHDSRLTSAIDLGHTLPPCLKPMLKPY